MPTSADSPCSSRQHWCWLSSPGRHLLRRGTPARERAGRGHRLNFCTGLAGWCTSSRAASALVTCSGEPQPGPDVVGL